MEATAAILLGGRTSQAGIRTCHPRGTVSRQAGCNGYKIMDVLPKVPEKSQC